MTNQQSNRRTVSGADSLKIGIFWNYSLFDYAKFQEMNSGDWWSLI